MANNNNTKNLNVPNLRFPEFTGEWEEKHLSELVRDIKDRISTSSLSIYNYVSTENILQNFQGVILATSIPYNANVIAFRKDDILFSNIRPYLKKIWHASHDGGCSADVLVFRNNDICSAMFLYHLIANDKFINYVMLGTKGTKMPRGDKQQIIHYAVYLPSRLEQNKIAIFLSLLDSRIKTQIKIIEDLKKLKSSLLDLLFQNNSKWSTYCICDVLTIGNGRDYKHLKEGNIPVYGTGGYMLSINDYLYEGESVCIGRKGTIDMPMFLTGKFWTVDTLFYTYNFRNILPRFCYYLFTTINWSRYNEASGIPSLSKTTIEKIKVSVPSLDEQQYICSIFDNVNNKINIEIAILAKLKEQKKYFLQEMFI